MSNDLLQQLRVHGAVPAHVAIIMDGNGRWAKGRALPRPLGHHAGMKAVREVVEGCLEAGVGVQVSAGLGLRDPDPSDGHIYMDEIAALVDHRGLTQAIGDIMTFNVRLTAQGYVRSELKLPWPLPDITLFDASFSIGDLSNDQRDAVQTSSLRKFALAGQGLKVLPAVMQGDTLIITGTSDRDFISLSGRDGTVEAKSPGIE